MSVARCQREVSSREYAEWWANQTFDPIGASRDDYRIATLTSLVYNAVKKPRARATTANDWMPQFDGGGPKRQSPMEMRAQMMLITKVQNSKMKQASSGTVNS